MVHAESVIGPRVSAIAAAWPLPAVAFNAALCAASGGCIVGSGDEVPGKSGFAHLFEHMMFQGSENIGKSEHFILVDTNGGNTNGTTNEERTLYYETLPANQLDLALFLEVDRMRSLDISKENLDNQRNAVQEERRLRLDNQAYGKMFEQFGETMYDNFAYKHSVIGSMADLNAASVEDVRDFFRTYYAPNNATLALVGQRAELGWPFFAGLGVAALLMTWQLWSARERERDACFRAFLNNNWVGAAVFAGIAAALL